MIIFFGIRGDFPTPTNKILPITTLPEEKARTWAVMIQRIVTAGFASRA